MSKRTPGRPARPATSERVGDRRAATRTLRDGTPRIRSGRTPPRLMHPPNMAGVSDDSVLSQIRHIWREQRQQRGGAERAAADQRSQSPSCRTRAALRTTSHRAVDDPPAAESRLSGAAVRQSVAVRGRPPGGRPAPGFAAVPAVRPSSGRGQRRAVRLTPSVPGTSRATVCQVTKRRRRPLPPKAQARVDAKRQAHLTKRAEAADQRWWRENIAPIFERIAEQEDEPDDIRSSRRTRQPKQPGMTSMTLLQPRSNAR